MKTQIITLEAHDDLISVRDRMSWAKSPRILLVWPRFEKVVLRPIDLRILQEHAHYLGADLGLVTRQGDVRRHAQAFDIPVFRSAAEAQRGAWPAHLAPKSGRRQRSSNGLPRLRELREQLHPSQANWLEGPIARIVIFAVAVLAVIALATVFVPTATIQLNPMASQQRALLPVQASVSNMSVSLAGDVPAHQTSVTVSGTQSVKVTTQAKIPEQKATGVAHFQNLTQAAIVIPAGTIVYSVTPSAARFATLSEVRLDGKLNAFVDVPMEALAAGSAGNIPANSIQAVEGTLGSMLSASNPEPTSGGTDRVATVPSDADRGQLRTSLLKVLTEQAKTEMQATIGEQDVLLPATVSLGDVEEETYEPVPGQPGSLLTLSMRLKFESQYVKAEDLSQLAQANLNGSLPDGFRATPHSLVLKLAGTPALDPSGTSRFNLDVQRTLVRDVDEQRAGTLVRGLSPAAARRVLQANFPLASPPQIRLDPSWWPWLPLIPFRIALTLP